MMAEPLTSLNAYREFNLSPLFWQTILNRLDFTYKYLERVMPGFELNWQSFMLCRDVKSNAYKTYAISLLNKMVEESYVLSKIFVIRRSLKKIMSH